jgi:hypothetical protein
MVSFEHRAMSIRRQCALLGLDRSGLYQQPLGESPENLRLMRLMDEHYTHHPEHGVGGKNAVRRDRLMGNMTHAQDSDPGRAMGGRPRLFSRAEKEAGDRAARISACRSGEAGIFQAA